MCRASFVGRRNIGGAYFQFLSLRLILILLLLLCLILVLPLLPCLILVLLRLQQVLTPVIASTLL
jgi:hypothetical protein